MTSPEPLWIQGVRWKAQVLLTLSGSFYRLGCLRFPTRLSRLYRLSLWHRLVLVGASLGAIYYFVYLSTSINSPLRFDAGNSNPTLNRNHIHDLPVQISPLSVQRQIAEVLSAYDNLIENNRRRMALLETATCRSSAQPVSPATTTKQKPKGRAW
jgi:hypothetical protein